MAQYLLADGKGCYIRHDSFTGKYVSVRNESLAERWDERYKAQNILKNCVSKKDRKKFHIIEEECSEVIIHKEAQEKDELHINIVKDISTQEYSDYQMDKWEQGLGDLSGFIQESEERKEYLTEALSNIDKEITDVEHYIELRKLNAYQGYLAYKMLRTKLKERRKIKDELHVLTQIGNCKLDSAMMKDVRDAIDTLSKRDYTPRVLTELFE